RAHEFATLIAAAERLKDEHDIVFLCVGGGRSFDELSRSVNERRLQRSFRFFPYQDRNMLKYSLSVADVHWISLKPQLEGLIVPSKFYGVAAAGKVIVAISAKNGEIAQLVEQNGCGVVIKPGDGKGWPRFSLIFQGIQNEWLTWVDARERCWRCIL